MGDGVFAKREEAEVSVLGFLTAWPNAPFTIAVGVTVVFALLQLTGILGLVAGGGEGADHDIDHDIDHDVDHDVNHDVNHDSDGDAHHDAERDHASAPGHGARGWGAVALAPLGLGKVPLSVIWQTYCLLFATTGLLLNLHYIGSPAGPPLVSLVWSLPVSSAVAYAAVAIVARVLGPIFSSTAQQATSRSELVGQTGVVISSQVDERFGEVRIRDKSGHDVRVVCKLHTGAKRPAREHQMVVVVEYQPERGELFVEPLDEEDDDPALPRFSEHGGGGTGHGQRG